MALSPSNAHGRLLIVWRANPESRQVAATVSLILRRCAGDSNVASAPEWTRLGSQAGRISTECVISAVFSSMAMAEQYLV